MRTRSIRGARSAWRRSVAAALLLAACSNPGTPAEEREARARNGAHDIVIAAVWPWEAHGDMRFAQGLDLAVEEVNAAGGIQGRRIRLLKEDDRRSVNEGLLVAQRLAENPDVVAVVGHLNSYVSLPAAAIYDAAGLVFVSPTSTSPDLTAQGYRQLFRVIFTDHDVGREMAEFAAGRGYRKVAIYYVRNAYGLSLANAFEERAKDLGVRVVQRASYGEQGAAQEGMGFHRTLREWKQAELDAIFLAGQVPEAGVLIASARREGITIPILGSDAMSSQGLITAGGAAVEGTVVPVPFHPEVETPEGRRFAQAFQARYGTPPDAAAALAYDAVMLLAHAMRRSRSSSSSAIARTLHELRDWPGVTGRLSFDARGDLVSRRMVKTVVRDGAFHYMDDALLGGTPR
jgi:branched-chain amino acid transport system substrate-binding protein